MLFDKNQTAFRDCLQERVWELGTGLLPLEMTLPYVPEAYQSACKDLYDFTHNLLADMYDNPDCFGFAIDPSKQDYENSKQVEFYYWFLFNRLYTNATLVDGQYEIASDKLRKILKGFNSTSIERLMKHGIVVEDKGDTTVISNRQYPDMFIGSNATMQAATKNYKVNCGGFVFACDFRAFAKYKRTYEDVNFVMGDSTRHIAEQLHEYSVASKIMPQKCHYFNRVDYKHKGKNCYILYLSHKNQIRLNIGFANIGGPAYEAITEAVTSYEDYEDFAQFCRDHLKKCTRCVADWANCGRKTHADIVFDQKTFFCRDYIQIKNPKPQDIKHIFRLLDLRVMLVQKGLAKDFSCH